MLLMYTDMSRLVKCCQCVLYKYSRTSLIVATSHTLLVMSSVWRHVSESHACLPSLLTIQDPNRPALCHLSPTILLTHVICDTRLLKHYNYDCFYVYVCWGQSLYVLSEQLSNEPCLHDCQLTLYLCTIQSFQYTIQLSQSRASSRKSHQALFLHKFSNILQCWHKTWMFLRIVENQIKRASWRLSVQLQCVLNAPVSSHKRNIFQYLTLS